MGEEDSLQSGNDSPLDVCLEVSEVDEPSKGRRAKSGS